MSQRPSSSPRLSSQLNQEEDEQNQQLEPSLDLQDQYAALPLEKRLGFLSNLLQQKRHEDYQNILRGEEELQNSDGFQAALKPSKISIQKQNWEQLSVGIFKTFLKGGVNQHYAMKIFLMHQQASLTSPLLMDKAYQAIKKLDVPEDCQDIHEEFLVGFTILTVDQLIEKVSGNVDESEEYGRALAVIIQSLKSSPPANQAPITSQVTVQDQYLKEFEADFGQFKAFKMAKEALYKKDFLGSSEFFKEIIGQVDDQPPLQKKFIEMYSSIIKAHPLFQRALSDDQVFYEFAPIQLQYTVTALFKQLKKYARIGPQIKADVEELKEEIMMSTRQDGAPSKNILDLLREIFNEDSRFNEMLCQYLLEQSAFADVVRDARRQIKSLKMLRQENLVKAFSQITQNEKEQQKIADFLTVNIDIDFPNLQKGLCDQFRDAEKLNGDTKTLLLYDLIKKKCNFGKFISQLQNVSEDSSKEMLFTQQFFLSYLLSNSDKYLRTMILMTCSHYIPLPLVSYQPNQEKNYHGSKSGDGKIMTAKDSQQNMKAAIEKKLEFTPNIYEELFYCFEKHKAVLSFKVSANPNKSPQGCTSLTNYVFNRTFETHSKSLVNYGSIDIQFDYNFEDPMFVPVADAHGLVDDEILERVYPLFNIFIIHTLSGLDHQEVANKQITIIRQTIENPLIFLIIHDERRKEHNFTSIIEQDIVKITLLGHYNDLLDKLKKDLRSLILQKFLQYIGDSKGYEANIPARLKSLQEFSDFAQEFRTLKNQSNQMDSHNKEAQGTSKDQIQLKESLAIIRSFMELIDANKENLRSEKVLKMNILFEEACQLEKRLLRDTSLRRETTEEYRERVAQLYKKMRDSEQSHLTKELKKIVDHKNYLGLTSIISKFVRSFLNHHLKPLFYEREKLRAEFQQLKYDDGETGKYEIFQKVEKINKTLKGRYYSNEFLQREYYISELSKFKGSHNPPSQSFNDYLSLCNLQISQGQPFEIIEGNNLQFIKEIYQRIQNGGRQDEEILVVSIIGPQSSGKSLLLNILFGTQFITSAGRCTRGIFGCLIDIKADIKSTRFRKILILDSEGLQSTEVIDEAFDKRVVFYILCVSHVVLICNKGEMNKFMEDTIKLATDCMMQVRQNIDQQPQVNIIMNNVQTNENSLYYAIQSLSNCLLEMSYKESQSQIFTIDQSNVFLLPNAFAYSGNEIFFACQPSYQFSQQVDKLRQKIINFMQGDTADIASYTLESWFKFAQGFWEFTDGYSRLTDYSTLVETKDDFTLGEYSKKLISDYFEDDEIIEKHKKMIQKEVKRILEQHQGFDQTHINLIKKKIDCALHPIQQELEQKIYDKFRKFSQDMRIHQQIIKRRENQLEALIKQHFFNWQQFIQQHLMEFNENRSRLIGDKLLQNAIERYIKDQKKQYTIQEAEILFNKEWNLILQQMNSSLKPKEQISEEQFSDIGQNLYREYFRQLIKVEEDRRLLSSYENLESKSIVYHFQQQSGFFYNYSKTNKPSSQQFKILIQQKKYFMNNKNLQFFYENIAQKYYNWRKIIEERFKYAALYEAFKENPQMSVSNNLGQSFHQSEKSAITQKYIEKVIGDIKNEANLLNIDITQEFVTLLFKIAQKSQESNGNDSIKTYVDSIKANIQSFFIFKKRDNTMSPPNFFNYFFYQASEDLASNRKIAIFSFHNYVEILDPQDQRVVQGGLEPLSEQQIYLTIKPQIQQEDKIFSQYLKYLVQYDSSRISSGSPEVERAVEKFYSLVDQEKVLKTIQKNVLENIFRNKDQIKYKTVEKLVNDLINSDNPNITHEICPMDMKVVQRIAKSIENIVNNINEDMDPYQLRVSEQGRDCLHQIAQTYIVRIMQEVIRLAEHAPLLSLIQSEVVQRDLFIAKLTSNDIEMDFKLAERIRRHLVPIIIRDLQIEQIKLFEMTIKAEQGLFKLKTIVKNIEYQILQIADGIIPDQFQIDSQGQEGESWWSRWLKMKGLEGSQMNQNQEEEKKQQLAGKMSVFKKMDWRFEFTPEEIIMFYAQPSDYLQIKFRDQWKNITYFEIKKAKENYSKKMNQIKSNFQQYFKTFLLQIQARNIQLSANIFIPEDHDQASSQYLTSQIFKVHCQKAMAIYMGLVLNKKWKDGTAIELDDHAKMINPPNIRLVRHEDLEREIDQRYVGYLQEVIQKEQISNIENLINALMSELEIYLDPELPENSLAENDLIGNLYQEMRYKTLGCRKICPLCRRQCDQEHDGEIPDLQIHCCDSGHQIQGFGGNMQQKDNKAVTIGCYDLNNKDTVLWKGTEIKWEKFKTIIFNELRWNFEHKGGALENVKFKNAKIWNKIGPFICEYYKLNEGIDIKFQKC